MKLSLVLLALLANAVAYASDGSNWLTIGKIKAFPYPARALQTLQPITDENLSECQFRLKSSNEDSSEKAIVSTASILFSGESRQLSFLVYSSGDSGQNSKAYSFSLRIQKQALADQDIGSDVKMFFGRGDNNELQMKCK